jgi:hypothetical protein
MGLGQPVNDGVLENRRLEFVQGLHNLLYSKNVNLDEGCKDEDCLLTNETSVRPATLSLVELTRV